MLTKARIARVGVVLISPAIPNIASLQILFEALVYISWITGYIVLNIMSQVNILVKILVNMVSFGPHVLPNILPKG